MIELNLLKKTGFRNLNPNNIVEIKDFRNMPFYSTENVSKPVLEFNLPSGKYYVVRGNITAMLKPVKYRLAVLPIPQRNRKPPFDFDVSFGNNPNKCSIIWNEKMIFFDNALREKTLPELWFILFHEFAHARYTSEHYADLCASNLMKVKGFNPSQIGSAPLLSLSAHQYARKKYLIEKIIHYAKR
jgi:hypothetical protein